MSASQRSTIHRTYQLRGHTSRAGYGRIREALGVCQRLYNRALAERIAVYRLTGKTMGTYAMMKRLTQLRRAEQSLREIDVNVERGALIRLDRAYQAFFRRVKAGDGFGFPRFKPKQRYTCVELAEVRPGMVKGNRIKIKGLPAIRIRPSRRLPEDKPVSMRLVLRGRILTVDLVYAEEVDPLPHSDKAVGIDMGVNERMTLSTGETVARRETDRKRQRVLQRAVSRKRKGSLRRRKGRRKAGPIQAERTGTQSKCVSPVDDRSCAQVWADSGGRRVRAEYDCLRRQSQERIEQGGVGTDVGASAGPVGVQGRMGRSPAGRSESCVHVPNLLRVWRNTTQAEGLSAIRVF